MVQYAGHKVGQKRQLAAIACKRINNKNSPNQGHAQANRPPRGFQHDDHGYNTHENVDVTWEDLVGDHLDVQRHPRTRRNTCDNQRAVDDPANTTARFVPPERGVDQETKHQNETKVNGQLEKQPQGLDARRIELKQRQRDADYRDRTHDQTGLLYR